MFNHVFDHILPVILITRTRSAEAQLRTRSAEAQLRTRSAEAQLRDWALKRN